MATEQTTLKGTLVAATAKPYELRDRQTGEIRKGTAYAVFIVTDFGDDPVKVKVRQDDQPMWAELDDAGPGAQVALSCVLSARDNRLERTLSRFDVLAAV